MPWLAPLLALALLPQLPVAPPSTPGDEAEAPPVEARVRSVVEDLRKAEMFLDADAMAEAMAHSFGFIEASGRVMGRFAYLEPLRRARERGDVVKELSYDRLRVEVFGASAVVTYHYVKRWRQGEQAQRAEGWCTDVFERRDDGAWVLVHRHRSR